MHRVIIHLHPEAPQKPPEGAPCNGCGVCCASEPCPLGILASRRRQGACAALVWSDEGQGGPASAGRYRCGLVGQPERVLPRALAPAAAVVARLARRLIASGQGCDCSAVVEPA